MNINTLNFHHLRYFWLVAKDGNLTHTAAQMRVSQSALSAQIRQLEADLGVPLFDRVGRRLVLTEVGRTAFAAAEEIFGAGAELLVTLRRGRKRRSILRLGATATLSRNFQESFVRPVLDEPRLRMSLVSGAFTDLLARLASHDLDLVLANRPARREGAHAWRSRRVAQQAVSIVGHGRRAKFRFPEDLARSPMILPSTESEVRTEFDALCEQLGARPNVLAEVDDMAMLRLLARDTDAIALVPSVVVRDELRTGTLTELCVVPGLRETFYAITVERHLPHPLVERLLARDGAEILGSAK